MEFGDFFRNFEKNEKPSFFFFFWKIGNTHTSYMVTFFNLLAILCVIANLFFLLTKLT